MKKNTDNLSGKRILLVTLDSSFLDDQFVFPNLGILYLVSAAASAGVPVDYTDNLLMADTWEYDVIGISCSTPQCGRAYEICRFFKKEYPNAIVMIGGPHATHYLEECMERPFDIIVCGDGERIFEEMLTGGCSRLLPESTQQQRVYCDNLTEDEMNSYPIPQRDNDYLCRYNYDLAGVNTTTLVNSRGCPMQCGFCESGGTKPKWFSVEHFEAEIKSIVEAGYKGVMIFDDLFALNIEKVRPYLKILKKYDMVFRCFGHAATMTLKMAELLVDSGCVEIGFGAESASQQILDTVNKRTRVGEMHYFVSTVIGVGMKVKAFFIIGLPGETVETFKETYDFIEYYREMYPDSFDFDCTVFFPYKGTLIGDSARNGGGYDIRPAQGLAWQEIDSNGYGAYKKKNGEADIVIETSGLSSGRIGELQKEALLLR